MDSGKQKSERVVGTPAVLAQGAGAGALSGTIGAVGGGTWCWASGVIQGAELAVTLAWLLWASTVLTAVGLWAATATSKVVVLKGTPQRAWHEALDGTVKGWFAGALGVAVMGPAALLMGGVESGTWVWADAWASLEGLKGTAGIWMAAAGWAGTMWGHLTGLTKSMEAESCWERRAHGRRTA